MTDFERALLSNIATGSAVSGTCIDFSRGIRKLKAMRLVVEFGGKYVVTNQGREALSAS